MSRPRAAAQAACAALVCGSARLSTACSFALARQLARDAPFAHHDDAIGHAQHFGQLRRHHHDRAAALREPVDHVVDLVLRAHVDAARRLVEDHDLQVGLREPARQDRLLLIAARQEADLLPAVRRLDLQPLDEAVGRFDFGLAVDEQPRAQRMAAAADVDVLRDRRHRDDPFLLAVLRTQHDAVTDRVAGALHVDAPAVERQHARAPAVRAVHEPHQLAASRAHQPEEADDLAPRTEKLAGSRSAGPSTPSAENRTSPSARGA
jgi:hypothetical protein